MVWVAISFFIMGSVAGAVLMSLCIASGRDRSEGTSDYGLNKE